jgi:class 3 adenylate cyclase/tetratricopeptide (TPR) repeat protein
MASVGDPSRLREERKIVTPLFADLVGSTSIGERFDPEDARDIISGAVALMIEAVERFGGTIKDLAGDGVLALFGAPVLHEDDVERAVLAGLTLSEAVSKYAVEVARDWGHAGLAARVGIDTGLAVVGPVGAGGRVEYGAVGDVLNTAFRLQSAARPGTVLVGETARREVADLFEWEPRAALSLKGKEEPVVASVVLRPLDTRGREAASRRPDPLFVGRSAELATIDRALSQLADGAGSAIFVIGEPGIGKSRLVAETGRRARSGRYRLPIRWLEARCLSYADNVPYGLFRDLIAGWLGPAPSDGAERRISGLDGDAHPSQVDPTDAPYLELLLTGGRGDAQEVEDAEAVRERTFAAVESTLINLAASGPLVVSLEDLQWADPTSMTLTERLVDAVMRAPLVIIATARPEPGHASTDLIEAAVERLGPHAHTISLESFTDEERRALAASLPGAEALPDGIRRAILDATEGNPLFLEEQFRSLADTGMLVLDADGRWRFEARGGPHIPRTVERVLLARIDRLPPDEKEVLVAASVLGREFSPELVTGLVTADGGDVRSVLDSLDRIDLVRAERHGSEVRYRFRHSLFQEAAYGSLVKRERRELHARAAAAIESSREGKSEAVAGALGHHLHEAGVVARAVPHLMTAGDRARDMFANAEALAWYDRALEALWAIPATERGRWDVVEANLHARRGNILGLAGRFEAARDAYRRSIELAASGDPLRAAMIRTEAAMIEITDHRYAEGLAELERAEQALGPVTDADSHDPERMSAWFDIQDDRMSAFYWMDDLRAYEELIDRVRPFVEAQGTARQRSRFFDALLTYGLRRSRYAVDEELLGYARANVAAADEAGVASGAAWARFNLGFTLLWTESFDESRDLLNQALHEGSRIGDLTLVSRSRTYLMVLSRRRGDEREVERSIEQVIASAQAVSLPEYEAMAVANRSWVHARAGRTSEAEKDARAALARWRSLPVRYPFDWMASWPLIAIELERGRTAEAIAVARDLFAEHQQPVPDELGSQLAAAIETWDAGERDRARQGLRLALPLARRLNLL